MAYQFECPRDGCCFLIRTDADREAEQLARAHARLVHRSRFAPADLDRQIDRVDLEYGSKPA